MTEESDEDTEGPFHGSGATAEQYESDDEIIESDIELEGEVVEADNDPPQKVILDESDVKLTLCKFI